MTNTQKAFEAAEQELQEKEIENLKNIIKKLLQKEKDLQEEKRETEEKIKTVRADIEDFKKGRLDKIKERHDTDSKANSVAPIQITIINDNSRTIYPTQPWRWNYEVVWNYVPYVGYTTTSAGTNNLAIYQAQAGLGQSNMLNTAYTMTSTSGTSGSCISGITAQNFSGGTYEVNGHIINL